jgi:hypothetical protein
MVSFVCEACQDTIKKPKLEAVSPFKDKILIHSTLRAAMLRSLALIAIQHFRGEPGKTIQVALPRNRSTRKET